MQAIFETTFDICYLTTAIGIGIYMIKNCKGNEQFKLFGIMALVLGLGDSFHLIPRAWALCTTGLDHYTAALGIGKFVTSITMTIFYCILYHVWRIRYQIKGHKEYTFAVYFLTILRIVLCLFPQNNWTQATSPFTWEMLRNIPFLFLGILIIVLFYQQEKRTNDLHFKNLWLTIVLSFGFYTPVVIFADTVPAIGMLMIPKTLAYVWAILIGYNAMKKELN